MKYQTRVTWSWEVLKQAWEKWSEIFHPDVWKQEQHSNSIVEFKVEITNLISYNNPCYLDKNWKKPSCNREEISSLKMKTNNKLLYVIKLDVKNVNYLINKGVTTEISYSCKGKA